MAPSDRRRRSLRFKRQKYNKRLELVVGYLHGTALAVLGLGALRFLFDPGIEGISLSWSVLALIISFAIEGGALYLIGYLKDEE